MENITNHLVITDEEVSLPDSLGFLLLSGRDQLNISSQFVRMGWSTLGEWRNPLHLNATISQFFLIYELPGSAQDEAERSFQAAELLWHYCVHTYSIGVEDSRATTNITHTDVNFGDVNSINFTLIDRDSKDTFTVHPGSEPSFRLDLGLQDSFTGSWYYEAESRVFFDLRHQLGMSLYDGYTYDNFKTTAGQARHTTWRNLESFTETIAAALTA
jgi:hypothetical protein